MIAARLESPVGPLVLTEAGGRITALRWVPAQKGHPSPDNEEMTALGREAAAQLEAYFRGRLTRFDLPLDYGSGFQEQVRRAMEAIPFGMTRSYGDLARQVGAPARAVGQACGANPIPILIPCHRVLGSNGLGGFSAPGGVETKVWLLRHEGAASLLI